MSIYVTKPLMPDYQEYIEEIRCLFESGMLTNYGRLHERFRRKLKTYLGVDGIELCTNGHLALELALQTLGLAGTGGEVITTPFTFVSTVHAIARNGLTPVFCDIREDTMTLDAEKLESLITDKTVAIMPVHVYGSVCDVERISEIAERHQLKVIYDAAHAFGVEYQGKSILQYGDASVLSFHATKCFNTIEGGAAVFPSRRDAQKFRRMCNYGIVSEEEIQEIGGNAKMDEFRAAMGLCNLRGVDAAIEKRREITAWYDKRLQGIPGLTLRHAQEEVSQNYTYYILRIDPAVFGVTRDDVCRELKTYGVYARKYFYPALNEIPAYEQLGRQYPTPAAHRAAKEIVTLPLHDGMNEEHVAMICSCILNLAAAAERKAV